MPNETNNPSAPVVDHSQPPENAPQQLLESERGQSPTIISQDVLATVSNNIGTQSLSTSGLQPRDVVAASQGSHLPEASRRVNRRRRSQTDDSEDYRPPVDTDSGDHTDEDFTPPPAKRRRKAPLDSTMLRSQQTAQDLQPFNQHNLPSPPLSTDLQDEAEGANDATNGMEFPIENGMLRILTINGVRTFKLQWSERICEKHGNNTAIGQQDRSPNPKRPAMRGFTPAEDDLLRKLKTENLAWKEIHERFSQTFGGRSQGALQVRYSTKLKEQGQKTV